MGPALPFNLHFLDVIKIHSSRLSLYAAPEPLEQILRGIRLAGIRSESVRHTAKRRQQL